MHCFSMPEQLRECLTRGTPSRLPATSRTQAPGDLAEAAREVPGERLLVETDAPYLTPQAVREQRNQPAFVAHTGRSWPSCEVWSLAGAGRGRRSANAR